ncbi:MAG: DUF5979 domain-containing protein [Defluviitaleaceae bacterium]|nr:DUF5979 domain-containing protein [Defluviitaleaceae bacterium]
MKTKKLALFVFAALILTLIAAAVTAIAADAAPYRIVLRYYDPMRITYYIKYPVGDSRDEWEGPEDIPVGGVGVPGPGDFDISSYISTQIYCVDPFVPFHGRVPDFGGSFIWNGGAMADTVSGFVDAAPWNMSGAMQAYGDAVRWIAANGYRGKFNYGGIEDAESAESVRRLNEMFPGIGEIDKEIAIMATKVAIWKTVAGNSVQVLETSIDDTEKRDVFDMLVYMLTESAANTMLPGPRYYLPGEVQTTSLKIEILHAADAYYDESADSEYSYYGPLKISALLDNLPSGAYVPDLEKIFVAASGLNSGGVHYVSQKIGGTSYRLKEDKLFGTDETMQYVTGSVTADGWTSDEFYLAVPKSRTNPERGDRLLLRAFAMAPGVEVATGTPVVYSFAESGVQNWNAIQSFIGGAAAGSKVNLFAEASWSTGDTVLGGLYVSKEVINAASAVAGHEFTFAVYYGNSENFADANRLNLTDNPVNGAYGVNTSNNTFTIKNGGLAFIQGLPTVVGGGNTAYEYFYWVEEMSLPSGDYETPHMDVTTGGSANYSVSGQMAGPFRLDGGDAAIAYVTVTNTYKPTMGELTIKKVLSGNYTDWGINNSTVFNVRIKDLTNDTYLLFSGIDNVYICRGNTGGSDASAGDVIKLTAGSSVTVKNLWVNSTYQIEEESGANYYISYTGNGLTLAEGAANEITVTNTYNHGTGDLIINKRLAGDYTDWGVNSSTVFNIRVKDVTNNTYLLFTGTGPVYECYGSGASGDTIRLTADSPVTITNLWANVVYEVEELSGANYAISYQGNGAVFTEGENSTITVTNTFEKGRGGLVVTKRLAGSFSDWGVDEDTVFYIRVKDLTNDNYLLFGGNGPVYSCYGNSGSGDPSTGDTIRITAGQPVTITNLWSGSVYSVEEVGGQNYAITYQGNNTTVSDTQNSNVTVINTYEKGAGGLVVNKKLAGSFSDWGVSDTTTFRIRINDVDNGNTLLFKTVPEPNGSYICIGNDVDGLSVPYNGQTTTELPLSAGRPLVVTNLWSGAVYEVIEADGANYQISYSGNRVTFSDGQNVNVTVTNTYEHGTGAMVVSKKLSGSYESWGVTYSDVFVVRIKDAANGGYLMFANRPGADGAYRCVGNTVEGLSEDYSGRTITELTISAGKPLVLKNLWVGHSYEVEERSGSGYEISYANNGAVFSEGPNSNVTVINTYKPNRPWQPNTPDEPDEPDVPDVPELPEDPTTPGGPGDPGEPDEPDEPEKPNIPQTGDDKNFILAAVLTAIGLILIAASMMVKRKAKQNN